MNGIRTAFRAFRKYYLPTEYIIGYIPYNPILHNIHNTYYNNMLILLDNRVSITWLSTLVES